MILANASKKNLNQMMMISDSVDTINSYLILNYIIGFISHFSFVTYFVSLLVFIFIMGSYFFMVLVFGE
jgi:hypothetical protein